MLYNNILEGEYMKCIKCRKNNVSQANYCIKCGYQFNDKDKEKSKKSFPAIVFKIKDMWDTVTLSKIKDKWWYRVGSFILVIGIGVLLFMQNGNHLKILKSNDYEISVLKNTNEYFLNSKSDETKLNLYLPHAVENIYVDYYSYLGEEISKNKYDNINDIIILVDNNKNYYKIYIDDKNEIILYPNRLGGEDNE